MINQLVVILFKYIDNHRVGGVGSNQYKKVEGAQSEPTTTPVIHRPVGYFQVPKMGT